MAPWKGAPLRVMVATEKPLDGELSLIGPDGRVVATSHGRSGGPPYFWYAEVSSPAVGTWRAALASSQCGTIAREITVRDMSPTPPPAAPQNAIWSVHSSWNRMTENLYSAWVQKLFDAPLDAEAVVAEPARGVARQVAQLPVQLSQRPARTRSPPRSVRTAPTWSTSCAPISLSRWAFRSATRTARGGGGKPPRCFSWLTNLNPPANALRPGLAASFGAYLPVVADAVQSGAVRVMANDDNTDFYTVPLTQQTLRPGTVYADPYGHGLMLVRRVPEANGAAGVFLAVDGQPDGTVARKRFWQGNFLFAHEPSLGNPGFKRFRPIVRDSAGTLRRLTNAEIAKNPQYGDFSLEQSQLSVDDFYDRMDTVMSPEPLDPVRAMKGAIDSLEEQVKTRVGSIENGRKFTNSGRGEATMPDGAAIFATTGAWEDFSTPARDFRLLIAIDVVRGYPDRVAQHPERYAIPEGKNPTEVKAELRDVLVAELGSRKFTYTRSDGSPWTLSLQDVIDRMADFEMAYNLNDCVELRWGAPEQSDEAATCKRHAPATQHAKMATYRAWFRERHWPTHA